MSILYNMVIDNGINKKRINKMNITLKENLVLNAIIGNYIISNSLYYDECKSLYKIVNNLKEARHDIKVPYKILLDKTPLTKDVINDIESNELKEARKEALKELRLYNSKSICNKKMMGIK